MTRLWRLWVLLVVAALVAGACDINIAGKQLAGMPPSYVVKAEFPSAIGLYPGSFVRQLGIDVGAVSKVDNQGDHVLVTMKVFNKDHLAAAARAILIGDSVLGERYVQFEPAYTGGPAMPKGTVLGPDRVSVPVETDTVLRSLNTVIRGINPTDIKTFITNLATLLQGQGQNINNLIANAAGTVSLLANKSNQLGQLTTTLATLSGQLDTRDQALAKLITDYDLLSGTLAGDRSQLDGTITQLTNLTTQATGLLAPNLGPIQTDVADLTTIGQTLDRNLAAIDVGLKYTPLLFGAARNAYDPAHNWLPLNTQSNPSETSGVLAGSVRDTLASICRRLAAKQPALAPALAACGNPDSGFFDPIVGLLPGLLAKIPGTTAPSSTVRPAAAAAPTDATSAFASGLAAIPGLTPSERTALAQSLTPGSGASPATGPTGAAAPATGLTGTSAATSPAAASAPGAAAVAALAGIPRGTVPTTLGPAPPLVAAPTHHHRGIVGGVLHWLGGLL